MAKASCGICPEDQQDGGQRTCSVCLQHLCGGYRDHHTTCFPCLEKAAAAGCLRKNDRGQWLDPVKQTPLATCTCGKLFYNGTLCFLSVITKKPGHAVLR